MSIYKEIDARGKGTGSYFPLYKDIVALNAKTQIRVDADGSVVTRGTILTDEGSSYEPFAGSSLSGTWSTITDTGTSIAVANSICTLTAGTTAGSTVAIYKAVDFAPLSLTYSLSISQRIANQDIYFGYADNPTTPASDNMFARFHVYGTDNTKISCESQSSADTGGNQGVNTQILLPYGLTTAASLQYRIDFNGKSVKFYIGTSNNNLTLVASHVVQIPNPYTVMYQRVRCLNGTTPASSTTISIDSITNSNIDIVDIAGEVTGNVGINQNVIISTVNSSTANVNAGETFTGTTDSTLGVNSIQVMLKTDQNCTIYVDQSSDGSNWDITDSYTYYYSNGGQSWTTQAVGSYTRVRVTNNSTTTNTSYFRLATALCPIVEALPRALSTEGNLKVGVYEIEDENIGGVKVGVSPMGELRTTKHVRLVGTNFSGTTFDKNFWSKTTQTGTGDATLASETMTLLTGATANSSIIVQSVRRGRYVGGCSNYYRGVIRVPAVSIVTGSNIRRWGAFDTTDGFFFETDGSTLSVVCRKGSSDTNKISSANFNGIWGSTYDLNANAHTYEIYWTNSSAWFIIDGTLLHRFSGAIASLTDTLNLLVGMQNTNAGGNTGENTLEVRTATINRLGEAETRPIWKYQHGANAGTVLKYGSGVLHKVTVNQTANGSQVYLYDALSATNPIALLTFTGTGQQTSLPYELDFYTGLYMVTANANTDATIIYE